MEIFNPPEARRYVTLFWAGSSAWFKDWVNKENKNGLLEITKDLLQQSYRSIPMATPQ